MVGLAPKLRTIPLMRPLYIPNSSISPDKAQSRHEFSRKFQSSHNLGDDSRSSLVARDIFARVSQSLIITSLGLCLEL